LPFERLGCPLGALIAGSPELMVEARRLKHLFGGAMRQAGIVAAAGVYALEHNIERLADDHARARAPGEGLAEAGVPVDLEQVETNFVQLDVAPLGSRVGRGAGAAGRAWRRPLGDDASDEAARGHAPRRRRRGHRARGRIDPARAGVLARA
jgi:threonine aldolase